MNRPFFPLVLLAALAVSAPANAQDSGAAKEAATGEGKGGSSSAELVKRAGEEFSQGKRAYKAQEFVEAAEHFEAADDLVPSANALRAAMTSRQKAGQLERAALLAELGGQLYSGDEAMQAEAKGVLRQARSKLFQLSVACDAPCRLIVGTSLVHGAPAAERILYLQPGTHKVRASWGTESESRIETVTAESGEQGQVSFSQPAKATSDGEGADDPSDIPEIDESKDSKSKGELPPPRKGWSPVVFTVGAVVTAGLAGVTLWSGIDTLQNPGQDAVKANCTSTDCSLYQDGLAHQRRTNILVGFTAASGLGTLLIGVLATDWNSRKKPSESNATSLSHSQQKSPRLSPWVGVGNGFTLGATGRF